MGIPSFYGWIYRKYNNEKGTILKEEEIGTAAAIQHLFFDYNSMIHPCAHKVLRELRENTLRDEGETTETIEALIIEEVILYTRYVMNLVKADFVYIMIDGVAPRAKINQQRERRYKNFMLKKVFPDTSLEWDSNKITPGTMFMKKLRHALDKLYSDYYKMHISDSDEIGEGEHKMMEYIDTQLVGDGKICIYGLDADLIMLSMQSKRSDDIVLLRDNTFNSTMKEEQRTFTYLNIHKLKESIKQELPRQPGNTIQDFVFACYMLGNDFLEHIPSLIIKEGGVNVLIKVYTDTLMSLGEPLLYLEKGCKLTDKVNKRFLLEMFKRLSKLEDYFFTNIYSKKSKVYKDIYDLETTSMNIITHDVIKYNVAGYKQRYYDYYGITNVTEACQDYIEGLYWVLGYYGSHKSVDWSWHYKHQAAPFITDLYKYVERTHTSWKLEESHHLLKKSNCGAMSQKEQLIMVLPRESLLNIMRENTSDTEQVETMVRLFRTSNSSLLNMMFPTNITLDMINKEYMWQSKVLFQGFDDKVYASLMRFI